MSYIGNFNAGGTIRFYFNTQKADGTPITLAGSPAVAVYKDASDTQSTAGVTLNVGFDSVTGLHQVIIDTSADGTFYSAGSDFSVQLTAGTVDSVSVAGKVLRSFSLANRGNVTVGSIANNAITSASIADNAITAAKVADGAIDAATFAAGAINAAAIADGAIDAATLAADSLTAVADAILKRDFAMVTGEAARSLLNAARMLRNKVSVESGTMTVTKEDDATAAWTASVTTDANADPITTIDPA